MDSLLKEKGHPEGIDILSSYDPDLRDLVNQETRQILENRPEASQATLDSIWNLQKKVDYENTHLVIQMIKDFGLPKMDEFQNGCTMESLIVFVHAPEELKEKVRNAIEPDLKSIDENRYNHIIWHLDGRNSN